MGGQKIEEIPLELVQRYDVRGPRYTSYPSALEWREDFGGDEALRVVRSGVGKGDSPFAIYLHLPFCRELCWFCGCNTRITKDYSVVEPYLQAMEREWGLVLGLFSQKRLLTQLHLGGGTPTYLSPAHLERLLGGLFQRVKMDPGAELSIEVDPRVTTMEHLSTLRSMGFNRLSLGVQDFDDRVQKSIHREQSFEETDKLISQARSAGFLGVNVDLIYGLPYQTGASFAATLSKMNDLKPDRIALYSYAHVPWLKKAQRSFERLPLPLGEEKFGLMLAAIKFFRAAGYVYIGMDHFALPGDDLSVALGQGTLQRNFMGYTTQAGVELYGFGVSAISEVEGCFWQNFKELPLYYEALSEGEFPVYRGLKLTLEDRLRQKVIQSLSCQLRVEFKAIEAEFGIAFSDHFRAELSLLTAMEGELVEVSGREITVLPYGQLLIRNVCMVFDAYRQAGGAKTQKFSRTI